MKHKIKVGIIGGSGLSDANVISNGVERTVSTAFGPPSDVLIEGDINGVPCVLLSRHGRDHSIMPTNVNYRANVWAMKSLGCTHLLVSTACGSLKEDVHPGDVVILDSFIDRTQKRKLTFFDGTNESFRGICHLPMEPAFCNEMREVLITCARNLNLKCHPTGTCVTIEGPRFSSKAESKLFKSWGCDVINMTTVPEVVLAKEAGLCYGSVALVTDYDCWRDSGSVVNVEDVLASFKENVKRVTALLVAAVAAIGAMDWDDIIHSLKEEVKRNTMLPSAKSAAKEAIM